MDNNLLTQDEPVADYIPVEVTLRSLLQAGVHFGSKTSAWNPKCGVFTYGIRNSTYIINLDLTIRQWDRIREIIVEHVAAGGSLLFVGTKKQAQNAVVTHATRCGEPFVAYKWNAGTLTNFSVVRRSIDRMDVIEKKLSRISSGNSNYTKKEVTLLEKELGKLNKRFGGIRHMRTRPTLMFITDARVEELAVTEAKLLGIDTIGLADTDCDPSRITHIIPANDDAVRSLTLFCSVVADAVLEGKALRKEKQLLAQADTDSAPEPELLEKAAQPNDPSKRKHWDKRNNRNGKTTKVFHKNGR